MVAREQAVNIRARVKDVDRAVAELRKLGTRGEKAISRINKATTPATKGLKTLNVAGRTGSQVMNRYAGAIGPVGAGLGTLGPGGLAAAAGVGALTLALGAGLRASDQFIESGDNIAKTAEGIGISTGALQELSKAAELSGVESRQLEDGLRRLQRRAGLLVTTGTSPAAKAFKKLDIDVRAAGGGVRSTGALFDESIEKLNRLGSQAEQTAAASLLFGEDAGPRLVTLLNEGEGGIAALREEVRELGIVMDDFATREAEAFANAITLAESRSTAAANKIGRSFAPISQFIAESEAGGLEDLGNFFDRASNAIAGTRLESSTLKDELKEVDKAIAAFDEPGARLRDQIMASIPIVNLTVGDQSFRSLDELQARRAEITAELAVIEQENNRVATTAVAPAAQLQSILSGIDADLDKVANKQEKIAAINEAFARRRETLESLRDARIPREGGPPVDPQLDNAKIEQGLAQLEETRRRQVAAIEGTAKATRDEIDVNARLIESLQFKEAQLGRTERAQAVAAATARLSKDASETQRLEVERLSGALFDQKAAADAAAEAERARLAVEREAAGLLRSVQTEQERLNAELLRAAELHHAGALGAEEYRRVIDRLPDQTRELTEATDEWGEAGREVTRDIAGGLLDVSSISAVVRGDLEGLLGIADRIAGRGVDSLLDDAFAKPDISENDLGVPGGALPQVALGDVLSNPDIFGTPGGAPAGGGILDEAAQQTAEQIAGLGDAATQGSGGLVETALGAAQQTAAAATETAARTTAAGTLPAFTAGLASATAGLSSFTASLATAGAGGGLGGAGGGVADLVAGAPQVADSGGGIFGGLFGAVGSIFGDVLHAGGRAGEAGNPRRGLPAAAFMGAPRLEGRGMLGLGPNEIPVIAERGEPFGFPREGGGGSVDKRSTNVTIGRGAVNVTVQVSGGSDGNSIAQVSAQEIVQQLDELLQESLRDR